jgi:hypothetical protein
MPMAKPIIGTRTAIQRTTGGSWSGDCSPPFLRNAVQQSRQRAATTRISARPETSSAAKPGEAAVDGIPAIIWSAVCGQTTTLGNPLPKSASSGALLTRTVSRNCTCRYSAVQSVLVYEFSRFPVNCTKKRLICDSLLIQF